MDAVSLPLTLDPQIDIAKFNAVLDIVRKALGPLGKGIKPIDGAAIQAELSRATQAAKQFSDQVNDGNSNSDKWLKNLLKVNQVTQLVGQLSATVQQLSQGFVEVDKASRSIGALGVKNFADFKNVMVDLSTEIPNTAAEIGDAIGEGIGSGVIAVDEAGVASVESAKRFVSEAGKLAVAGGSSIGKSVSALASTLNAYQLPATEAARISDVLFNTFNLGVASVDDLASYLSQVTPVAAAAKVPFEQIAAGIATMTKQGIKVPDTTTKIKAFLVELQKPTPVLKAILDQAGVSIEKIASGELSLQTASAKIGDTVASLGKSVPSVFSSIDAATTVLALSGQNAAVAMQDLDGIAQRGTVAEGFATQFDSAEIKAKLFLNSVEGVVIKAFDAIGGSAVSILNATSQLAPTLTTVASLKSIVPPDLVKNATAFAKSILSGIVPGLFAQAGATGTATAAQTGLNAAMTANPIGAIIAGIVVLGAAFVALYKYVQPFRDAVDSTLAFLVDGWNTVLPLFEKAGGVISSIGSLWLSGIVAPFEIGFSIISSVVGALLDLVGVSGSGGSAMEKLGQVVQFLSDRLNEVQAFIAGFKAAIGSVIDTFSSVISKLKSGDIFGAIGDLGDIGENAGNSFRDAFSSSIQDSKVKDAADNMAKIVADTLASGVGKVDVGALTRSLSETKAKIAELSSKGSQGGLTDGQQAELESLKRKAEETAGAIAAVAPEVVASVRPGIDAQGNLVELYDINIGKAEEFAKKQQGGFDQELLSRQKQYSAQLLTTASIYEQQKAKLAQVRAAAEAAARAGDTDTARKKIDEYNELAAQADATGAAMTKAFTEGGDAGLLTEEALRRVAQANGITEEQARKQLLALALKKASQAGAVTESQIAEIAKKFGVSKEEARRMLDEQLRQTEEAKKTADAVKDIGEAFDESLKAANEAVTKGISKLAGLRLEITNLRKQRNLSQADKERLANLEEQYQAEYQSTKELDKQRDNQNKVLEDTKALFETKKAGASRSNKDAESEYAIRKKGYDQDLKGLTAKQKLAELERERARLEQGRQKDVTDELVDTNAQLRLSVQQAIRFANALKTTGIDTTVNVDQLLGDRAALDAFIEKYGQLVSVIGGSKVEVDPKKFGGLQTALDATVQGLAAESVQPMREQLLRLASTLSGPESVAAFKGNVRELFQGSADPASVESFISQIDTFIGKNLKDKSKIKSLSSGLRKLIDNIGREVTDPNIQIGVKFGKGDERQDAENVIQSILPSLRDLQNKKLEIGLKARLDDDAIRDATEKGLRAEIDLGIRNKDELTDFIRADIGRLQDDLEATTQAAIDQADKLLADGAISAEEHQSRIKAIEQKGTQDQIAIQQRYFDRLKELRDIEEKQKREALDREFGERSRFLEKQTSLAKTLTDTLARATEGIGKVAVDADKQSRLDRIKEEEEQSLISKEQADQRREELERRSQDRLAAIQEQARGQQAEADRQAEVTRLQLDRERLDRQRELAIQFGRTDEAQQIAEQLETIDQVIADKGDFLLSRSEELQGNLTDVFQNLFAGNGDAVKDSFRKPFAALAGGLQTLMSAKISEVLLSLIGPTGFFGVAATFALKPFVTSLIGQFFNPIINQLLSFPTGARFDQPTLALIGDGSRLGGSDREWLFRDDQLQQLLDMVMMRWNGLFVSAIDRLGDRIDALQFRLSVSGRDLATAVTRSNADRRRRTIPAALATR